MTETDGSNPLRDRQETFCQIYSQGKVSATQAYKDAGYAPKAADVNSHRLIVKDRIKARIAHLRAKWAEKHEVTRETLASEYSRAYDLAVSQQAPTSMVQATSGKARLYGLDKQVIEQHDAHRELTTDQTQKAKDYAQFKLWQANRPGRHSGTGKGEITAPPGIRCEYKGTDAQGKATWCDECDNATACRSEGHVVPMQDVG